MQTPLPLAGGIVTAIVESSDDAITGKDLDSIAERSAYLATRSVGEMTIGDPEGEFSP